MMDIICQACLSKDRRLFPLQLIESILENTKIDELNNKNGGVCWECRHLIIKFYKFKKQICIAQRYLTEKVVTQMCLSSLTTRITLNDFDPIHKFDPLINNENKAYLNEIKEENEQYIDIDEKVTDIDVKLTKSDELNNELLIHQTDFTDNTDININSDENSFDYEEKPIFIVNDINNKTYKKIKKEKHRSKLKNQKQKKLKYDENINGDIVKEKFFKIVFSVEDMIKNREEKRNQPNFKKIPYNCDSCVLGFTRKENYDEHVRKKHCETIGPYTCAICLIRYPIKKPLEKHCIKHFVCYKCNFCNYKTVEAAAAFNHCMSKHSEDSVDRIHCQQCTVVVRNPEELAEHIKIHHSLHCKECGKQFKGKHTLRTHTARIHGVKREFICDICHKTFLTKTRLESHIVAHNSTLAKRLAYCIVCKVQYKNIYVYRNHLKNSTNHAERAYPCPECNKKFASKVYWTKHYNFYHLKKSQFKCEVCNKLFISDWRLKNHKQTQHGLSRSRNHPCSVCGKKFFTRSTLRAHLLTHSEQRSFMCEDCGDTFKQRPALYTHCRLVHNNGKRKQL